MSFAAKRGFLVFSTVYWYYAVYHIKAHLIVFNLSQTSLLRNQYEKFYRVLNPILREFITALPSTEKNHHFRV